MGAVREEMNLLANLDGSSGGGERRLAVQGRRRMWGMGALQLLHDCRPQLPTPAGCVWPRSPKPAGDIERYCSDLSALLAQKQASLSQLQLRLHAFQQLVRSAMHS